MILLILIVITIIIFIINPASNFGSESTFTLETPGYGVEVYPFPTKSDLVPSDDVISLNPKQTEAFVKYMQSDPNIALFMSDKKYNAAVSSSGNSLESLADLYCLNYNETKKTLVNCDPGSLSNNLEYAYYIKSEFDYDVYTAIWTTLTNRYKFITDKIK